MAALKEELRREILEELGQGQWIDQEHSVLGRNKHVRACRRLIREDSPDVHCHDGRWLIRASALDREIQRENRRLLESGKLDEPPVLVEPLKPAPKLPPMTLAKAPPEYAEDETGIYDRGVFNEWLEKMR